MQKYIDEKGHLKDILQLKKEIAIIDGNRNVEDLTNRARRYSDAAEAAKLLVNGKPLTDQQKKLIQEVKDEYFGANSWWAKAWYNDNDLVQWANKMAGSYGKQARREAAVNAATRFQDVVSDMTDAQLQTLQKVLREAKSKKKNVVISAYKELANVTLTQDDIDKLATYTGGIIDSRQAKARTKKVIEDERKAAQAQLDALTVSEANSKKGAELRKKILGYTKELEAFDVRSSAKSGVSAGESAEKIAGLQMEQAAKLRRAAIDIEFSTRQAELNAQEESTSKAVALIELDHDKRLEAIRREFEDLRSERIKEAKALWDADASKKGVNFYESEAYRKAASESLTDEQQKNFDARVHEANKLYVDELKKVMDAETQAMYDYLSQYGSIQQMKLAITKDYDKRIAKAQNEWQRKQLEKERDAAIEQITSENLLRQADLSNVFSQYGIVLAAPLEEALAQLKKYTETASFKTRSFQDQQGIYGTIANLESQLNGIGGVTFSEIGRNLYEYNNALVNYTTASEELAVAAQESIDAKEALNAAEELLAKATTDEARLAAQRARDEAQGRVNAAGTAYGTAQAKFDNAQNALAMAQSNASESLQRFQRSIENVGKVASALASGSMRQLWDAFGQKTQKRIVEFVSGSRSYNKAVELAAASLSKQGKGMDFFVDKIKGLASEIYNSGEKIEQSGVGDKISALFDKLFGDQSNKMGALGNDLSKIMTKVLNDSQEAGEDADSAVKKAGDAAIQAITKSSGSIWGLIVGLIFDLLDVLAEGIGGLIETILEKVGSAIEGILTNIGSGKFFEQLASGVSNLVGGVIKGIGNLFSGGAAFGGSNVDDMEEEIARLSQANEALAKSIDSLAKSISDKDNTNQQSEEAYKRALAAEKEWQENQRKAIDDRASEWSGSGHGFLGLGGKHSFNAYLNDKGSGWYGWRDFTRVMKENGYDKIIQSAGDIWNLSPEMMKLLRDYAPQAWAELLNTDGEANPEELIDDYIARAGAIDELTSALNEKLTGYTWDGFKSSYVDMLKNLDSTNQDFADNMEEMLTSAILNSLVNEAYKDRIQALYKMIADAASDESEGGSQFTQNELAAIRLANETLSDDLLQARQNLIDAGVLKQTGSGSSSLGSSIKGISEQTGDLLASYVNAGRADLSVIRATLTPSIEALVKGQEQSFTIANAQLQTQNQMLHQLEIISGHTAAIGEIRQFQQNIYDILHRVTPDGTAVKIK